MSGVLVAGMGNVLAGDDGFGVEVARRLRQRTDLPEGVKVIEVGTGGIHLVQELMDGYDALVVVDAVQRASAPGSMHVLEAEVSDLDTWGEAERRDFLADMHYTTPSKALILAKALGVLPPKTYIFGCQPEECGLGTTLSSGVQRSIETAVERVCSLVAALGGGDHRERPAGQNHLAEVRE